MYPEALPQGKVGETYPETTLTLVYPDTIMRTVNVPQMQPFTISVTFTQFKIDSISGVPAGMSLPLQCNKPQCTFPISQTNTANNRGCLTLSGTPTAKSNDSLVVYSTAEGTYVTDSDVIIPPTFSGFLQLSNDTIFRKGEVYDISNPPQSLIELTEALKNLPFPIPGGGMGLDPAQMARFPYRNSLVIADTAATVSIEPLAADLRFSLTPNPVNATSQIVYQLNNAETVRIQVLDLSGRVVAQLANETQNPGVYRYSLQNLTQSGLYFVQVQAGSRSFARKFVVE